MKKIIVYVIGGLYNPNGMAQTLSSKANYLAEYTDYQIHIILTEKKGVPLFYHISSKISIVNFDINFDELDTMPFFKKLYYYGIKQRKYERLFREYLMNIHPNITVSAMRREINFINTIPDGSKKVGEIHFSKDNYRQFHKRFLPEFVNRAITKYWTGQLVKEIKKLSCFVVLSEEDRKNWTELKNVKVIHNPLSSFPEKVSDCSHPKVIAVGRYVWEKGFDLLVEAWIRVNQKHPDWKIHLYGNGNKDTYQQMANRKGIQDTFICHNAVKNITQKYRESSIFVLSSRFEGFGMVIAEAMSCGLPTVSFDCPCGPKEILSDKEDGLLVNNGNIEQLAENICFLIEHDHIRKEMGIKARSNAERFKIDKIMQQWIKLFNEL